MRNSNKILVGATAMFLGAAAWLFTREESPQLLEGNESTITQATEQEKKKQEALPPSDKGSARTEIHEKIESREDIHRKYNRFQLSGLVKQNEMPLSNVNIEARVASIIGDARESWKTTTDSNGRFSVAVPSLTSYDIKAQLRNHHGAEKTREVTAAPSDNIVIMFADSPDVVLRLKGNDSVARAVLQTANQKTLEGKIRGNEAVFEDVLERTLYNAFIATKNNAVIKDQIPVFNQDVNKEYDSQQTRMGQIQVRDAADKTGIAGAEITLTLPDIDPKIFANKVTTNQDGLWRGWLTLTQYSMRVRAEDYAMKEVNVALDRREGEVTILLDRGAVLKGKVIDPQNQNQSVAGAEVYLLDPLDLSPYGGIRPVMTNAAGEFAVRSIDPNRPALWEAGLQAYVPVAVKNGYMQQSLDTIIFNQNEKKEIILELAKTTEQLEGRVTDNNNNPLQAWLEVALVNLKGSGNVSNAPFWQKQSLETNPDGSFVLRDLAPGTYIITAIPGEDAKKSMTTKRKVIVPAENPVHIALDQGVALEGKVLRYNGDVARDVNLMFSKDNSWNVYTRTNNQGVFNLVAPEGPVKYYAWWKNEEKNGALEEQNGRADITGKREYTLLLNEKKYLTVQVTDAATKQPIPSYTVIWNEREGPRRSIIRNGFDEKGVTYLPLQDPFHKSYVVVRAQGCQLSERREVTNGANQTISIALKKKE